MTRRNVVLAALAVALGSASPAAAQILPGYQGDYDAAKAQFRAYALGEFQTVLAEWLGAVQAGDTERAMRLYADDAFVQLSVVPAKGPDQIGPALKQWVSDIERIQSGLADFDASGSLAYGTVRIILDGTTPTADGQGMMLIVLRRFGGDWKIRAQTLVLYDD